MGEAIQRPRPLIRRYDATGESNAGRAIARSCTVAQYGCMGIMSDGCLCVS